jgi:TatD DNase family protein
MRRSVARYFDSHVHFTAGAATAAVLARAAAAGVARLLAVGGSQALNEGARQAAAAHPQQLLLALGLDRDRAARPGASAEVDALLGDAALPPLAAVGEIGLDYHHHAEGHPAQCALLEHQLAWAARLRLPVCVHTRAADDDTLAILRNAARDPWFRAGRPGVIHCFTGGPSLAEALLELGYFLSFSGIVTFANAAPLRAVAASVPDDRLLIETDSPYLTPVPLRGRPNEPANVVHVAACLASARQTTPEALAELTWQNARRLFDEVRNSGQNSDCWCYRLSAYSITPSVANIG